MNEQKIIHVRGNGRANAVPDSIIISMRLETNYKEYQKTVQLASSKIERLFNKFIEAGFSADDIKTTKFKINTTYCHDRGFNSKNDFNSTILEGYEYRHDLKLQFDFDKDKLAKAIEVITSCELDPKFSINFTVKDVEKIKNEVLKLAFLDAKIKADILCTASNSKLGDLINIDCVWHFDNFRNSLNLSFDDLNFPQYQTGGLEYSQNILEHYLSPDDFSVYETVDFTWQISK